MCFMCFCVFPQRSQVTPPMCSVCFCILLTTFSSNLVQTGATTPCVLCVFVFFFHRSQVTTPMYFVCFCVFFTNAQFDPSLDRGNRPMCFMCFCVFFHRSQVTPPMCFVCFCVFFTNAQFDPSSDRCNHPMCFVCFLNKYMCPTQIPEILDQQNVAKLILNKVKRGPVDCANNVVRAEADIFSLTSNVITLSWTTCWNKFSVYQKERLPLAGHQKEPLLLAV